MCVCVCVCVCEFAVKNFELYMQCVEKRFETLQIQVSALEKGARWQHAVFTLQAGRADKNGQDEAASG